MKTRGNFIWAIVIVLTILVGIGTTGRHASANDYPSCFAPGDEIFSATFSICVYEASNQEVRLHRITEMWTESDVTWDNAPSYDSSVEGSFTASLGCQTVDVKALVQAWINGTYENNGILLEQNQIGLTWYRSSEYEDDLSLRPSLEICFAFEDCITIQRPDAEQDGVADAYIWALPAFSGNNFGSTTHLNTGILNDYEKQSLVRFEIPTCEKCWLTAGGVKFSPLAEYRGPKDNVGGNVYPGCSPDAGDGGSWTHIAHREKLHFHGTDITVVECGNVDGIEPGSESPVTPYNYIEFTGTGTLKGIHGNKDVYDVPVCFFARAEDRNEPGNEKALGVNGGDDIDRYFLSVYDCNDMDDELLLIDNGNGEPETITGGNFQIHISSCDN